MKLLPQSLFGRTAAVLLAAFLVFEAVAFWVVWGLVVEPLAQRSADNLAGKLLLATQTWVELPPETRGDYENELALRHHLELGAVTNSLPDAQQPDWFGRRLEAALSQRGHQHIRLKRGPDPDWDWIEVQMPEARLRIGYERAQYELKAPLAGIGVFLLGAALTLVTALVMVLRASRQLRDLAEKAKEVGQGRAPVRLPETGAQELKDLTVAFNRMAEAVTALLENRTVLLAGISHDLRTPITRLRLALSMLDEADPAMVARMERDLDEMNRLITDMLAFARALQSEQRDPCNLVEVLGELAMQAALLGPVSWRPPNEPRPLATGTAALRRIVSNLLENARRYGGEAAIDLALVVQAGEMRIRVLDRGPGIPAEAREAVFRPFYRLESSRSKDSGGSGLGLAIARQLADAHGWHIQFSDRSGGGLVAELVIPA